MPVPWACMPATMMQAFVGICRFLYHFQEVELCALATVRMLVLSTFACICTFDLVCMTCIYICFRCLYMTCSMTC